MLLKCCLCPEHLIEGGVEHCVLGADPRDADEDGKAMGEVAGDTLGTISFVD